MAVRAGVTDGLTGTDWVLIVISTTLHLSSAVLHPPITLALFTLRRASFSVENGCNLSFSFL